MVRVGNGPEAERLFRDSLAIRERLAAADPGSADPQSDLSYTLTTLGDLAQESTKLAEAETFYRRALAVDRHLAEMDETNARAQQDLDVSFQRLGDLLTSTGNTAEARQIQGDHLEWLERRLDPDDPAVQAVRDKLQGLDRAGQ